MKLIKIKYKQESQVSLFGFMDYINHIDLYLSELSNFRIIRKLSRIYEIEIEEELIINISIIEITKEELNIIEKFELIDKYLM